MDCCMKPTVFQIILIVIQVNTFTSIAAGDFQVKNLVIGEPVSGKTEFRLGVMAPDFMDYSLSPLSLNSTVVTLKYSVEKMLPELLPNYYFNMSYVDSSCDSEKFIITTDLIHYYRIQAIFGPMCINLLASTASAAKTVGINALTVGSQSLANGKDTMVRLISPFKHYGSLDKTNAGLDLNYAYVVNILFVHFGWPISDIVAVYHSNHTNSKGHDLNIAPLWCLAFDWVNFVAGERSEFSQLGLHTSVDKNGNEVLDELTERQLKFLTLARTFVLGMEAKFVRQFLFMIFCEKKGKFKIEEYVIIYLQPSYVLGSNIDDRLWKDPDSKVAEDSAQNKCLKRVFRHVLIVRPQDTFAGNMQKYEQIKYGFNRACALSPLKNCQVLETPSNFQYVAATYDGVRLLMQAMNKSISENNKKLENEDVNQVLFPFVAGKHFYDSNFAGASDIVFNDAGERVTKMELWRMEDTETGIFSAHVVFDFDGTNVTKGPGVPWIGGSAPKNNPGVVSDNQCSHQHSHTGLTILIFFLVACVVFLLAILTLIGIVMYTRGMTERSLRETIVPFFVTTEQ